MKTYVDLKALFIVESACLNEFPKLDAPGAGLPWFETFFLRNFYYPAKVYKSSWADGLDRLQRETSNIIKLCEPLSDEQFQTRILIPRLKGMEDSSRFWSVGLTIQHLLITIKGMSYIALELAQNHKLSVEADTASVKPRQEDVTSKNDMLKKLQASTDKAFEQLISFRDGYGTTHKVWHPWFGHITAKGWIWVIGQHQALHRKQIQLIMKQL